MGGKAKADLMTPGGFDTIREKVAFMSAVVEGIEDAQAGRVFSHSEMLKRTKILGLREAVQKGSLEIERCEFSEKSVDQIISEVKRRNA